MAGAFEFATRAAIDELIQTHAQSSKFGFVLTEEGFRDLSDALFDLLVTSRNLKSAGDRLMSGGRGIHAVVPTQKPPLPPPSPRVRFTKPPR